VNIYFNVAQASYIATIIRANLQWNSIVFFYIRTYN
jgi:hypothetical protein